MGGEGQPVAESQPDEEFDPKAYMLAADAASPVAMELWPGADGLWNVYKKGDQRYDTTGKGSLIGSIYFDPQDDVPANADQSWKEFNWFANPLSPTRAQKAFRTKNEAIDHLLDSFK